MNDDVSGSNSDYRRTILYPIPPTTQEYPVVEMGVNREWFDMRCPHSNDLRCARRQRVIVSQAVD